MYAYAVCVTLWVYGEVRRIGFAAGIGFRGCMLCCPLVRNVECLNCVNCLHALILGRRCYFAARVNTVPPAAAM